MQSKRRPNSSKVWIRGFVRGFFLASAAVLIIWMISLGDAGQRVSQSQQTQAVAEIPVQNGNFADVPPPVSTGQPTIQATATRQITPTPTIHILPSPMPIEGITTSAMTTSSEVGVSQKSTVDSSEPISQFIWAPTGDKILYLTQSGKLYWSNPDGTNATLLHQYDEVYDQLEDQMPISNTLLVRHLGQLQPDGERAPSHMDVIQFTPGQPPSLQESSSLAHAPIHLRWWSSTRASGIAHTGSDGGDLLVTLDENGNLVSEINVPYMLSGAVSPGGTWLAYATSYQISDPVDGSSPQTVYLLNLNTGQRLQVTGAGQGSAVGSWSPDGNWFLMSSNLGVALVSADGHEWVTIPDNFATVDAVWSPDSKYVAYAELHGQSADGYTITSWSGKVHIVNVPARKVTDVSPGSGPKAGGSKSLMWQPRWSRDGSLVSLLSFDPNCPFHCSLTSPAIFNMAPSK